MKIFLFHCVYISFQLLFVNFSLIILLSISVLVLCFFLYFFHFIYFSPKELKLSISVQFSGCYFQFQLFSLFCTI